MVKRIFAPLTLVPDPLSDNRPVSLARPQVNVGSTTYLAKVIFRIYKQDVEDNGIDPNASSLTASSNRLV